MCILQDHESKGEVKEDINEQLSEINDQEVSSSIDPVIDDIVINNEVTIVTDGHCYNSSDNVTSSQHGEAAQPNSPIIIQEGTCVLLSIHNE